MRMIIAAVLLAAAAPAPRLPNSAPPLPASALGLGELPPQVLAANSCALFLWERATRRRVAMALATPGRLQVVRGAEPLILAQTAAEGVAVLGFAPRTRYAGGGMQIAADLVIAPSDAGGGAVIREGVLALTDASGTTVVAPVAGLIGCN